MNDIIVVSSLIVYSGNQTEHKYITKTPFHKMTDKPVAVFLFSDLVYIMWLYLAH